MTEEKTFEERVKEVLEDVRPLLQRDGGDCELVGFDGKKVKIRLQGACAGCPGAQMTLKMGIERHLKEKIAEVEEVIPA
ncbi:MAG: nitrogen fixation protein NifU [Phycisphaerae bacterium SM23_30]|nr:MAG: nitrogen fixation protein NifU [Phycisphaerae bacterium SM23_30]